MNLYLIRHGKTYANEAHLYCGSTDLPLTPQGIEELKQLRYEISQAAYLTSGMLRTEQTLEVLFGDVPHKAEPRFREVDFGCFEMKRYEQLKDDPAYQNWLRGDNEQNVPPGGESGSRMRSRVLEALEEVSGREKDVVIITHGGVIAVIMEHLFPWEGKNRYQWQPETGRGYVISGGGYRLIPEK